MVKTPILFLVFNRPETTAQVFDAIRKARPSELFIAADGPRQDKIGEAQKCDRVLQIVSEVDWPCEVKTLFREKNLGCRRAVSSAITWFFEQVDQGIIIEDDCLPNDTFFRFCTELLERYKHSEEVMHISGTNLLSNSVGDGSYYASKYPHIWGWATWRRAWSKYSLDLGATPELDRTIGQTFKTLNERKFWKSVINLLQSDKIDTWDYQWMISIWKSKGICLNSNFNLIENIGFGEGATHTIGENPYKTKVESFKTIQHPSDLLINRDADKEFATVVHFITFQNALAYYYHEAISFLKSVVRHKQSNQ